MGAFKGFCATCCIIFPPFILQSVGLFSPEWVSNSACDSVELIYSCCTGTNNNFCGNTNGGDELDVRVLGLEATSFAMMFLAVLVMCCDCRSDDDKKDETGCCGALGTCCIILLPVAEIPSRHQASSNRVMPYKGGGAAPYGGARIAVTQVEQQAVIHDEGSGSLFVFIPADTTMIKMKF